MKDALREEELGSEISCFANDVIEPMCFTAAPQRESVDPRVLRRRAHQPQIERLERFVLRRGDARLENAQTFGAISGFQKKLVGLRLRARPSAVEPRSVNGLRLTDGPRFAAAQESQPAGIVHDGVKDLVAAFGQQLQ